jgi:hypothetical protein
MTCACVGNLLARAEMREAGEHKIDVVDLVSGGHKEARYVTGGAPPVSSLLFLHVQCIHSRQLS